jgi:hypothetical protein
MRGIQRLRSQDRENLFAEMRLEPFVGFAIDGFTPQDEQARIVEQDAQIAPDRLLARHQGVSFPDDRIELLPCG